jgi:hypothetical protein
MKLVLAVTAALSLFATLGIGLTAPANAATFSWTYSGTGINGFTGTDTGSGTLTTGSSAPTCPPTPSCSYVNSPYTTTPGFFITSFTGTWDGFTISGLVDAGKFDLNNNVLYLSPNLVFLNASANGQPSGVAFFVSNYTGENVPTPTNVAVALFFGTSMPSGEYGAVTGNTGFGCCSSETGGAFTVSEIGATPLPAALPLFATGLGGLGLLGWRRKRKAQAVG